MKPTALLLAALLGGIACNAHSAANILFCGELQTTYGPFDYRDSANAHELLLVETAHFTSNVEQGIGGNSGTIGQELNYTLRAFPNHHRALTTVGKLALRDKVAQIPGMRYPAECYFDRAIRFVPDDGAVRGAFGSFLYASGQPARALGFLEQGAKMDPSNAALHYNLGLAYFKVKRYEEANLAAQRAYAAQFPLPGLRKMLQDAGKWDESVRPAPVATEEEQPAAEQAAAAEPAAEPAASR